MTSRSLSPVLRYSLDWRTGEEVLLFKKSSSYKPDQVCPRGPQRRIRSVAEAQVWEENWGFPPAGGGSLGQIFTLSGRLEGSVCRAGPCRLEESIPPVLGEGPHLLGLWWGGLCKQSRSSGRSAVRLVSRSHVLFSPDRFF